MEIYKIKRNGCEVNVIFTGKQYIFHNYNNKTYDYGDLQN
nr:MAG TPA: hypothetical protein [Caudoviricetes sp.]